MTLTNLFETTLMATKHRGLTPLNEDASSDDDDTYEEVQAALQLFAEYMEDNFDNDLSEAWTAFTAAYGIDDEDAQYLGECLTESTKAAYGNFEDASVIHFLKQLAQPLKSTTRYPNQSGMTPLKNETGIKAFLKQLPISSIADPFGNRSFSADKYTAFDRQKNRMGVNYSVANDYNSQKNRYAPLANPRLNVSTEAFAAVDSQGQGFRHQYKVVNLITNEYVSKQMDKSQAEEIAKGLNNEFAQMLDENGLIGETTIQNPNTSGQGYDADHVNHPLHNTCVKHGFAYSHSTPIHQRDSSVITHHTWAHGEHRVGAYADDDGWQSKTSTASGHSTEGHGAGALDKHLQGKVSRYKLNKGEQIAGLPSLAIEESLFTPLDPSREARYLEAFQRQNYKKQQDKSYLETVQQRQNVAGTAVTHSDSPASEWQKTQTLINEHDKHKPAELSGHKAVSNRSKVRQASERTELEQTSRAENQAFLDKHNTNGSGSYSGTVSGSYNEKTWGKF
jgi:hypothetical protein